MHARLLDPPHALVVCVCVSSQALQTGAALRGCLLGACAAQPRRRLHASAHGHAALHGRLCAVAVPLARIRKSIGGLEPTPPKKSR
jgi:hypothetical protein